MQLLRRAVERSVDLLKCDTRAAMWSGKRASILRSPSLSWKPDFDGSPRMNPNGGSICGVSQT